MAKPNKPKKSNGADTPAVLAAPTSQPAPDGPVTGESPEQRQARANSAGEALRAVLAQYNCVLNVSNLNIGTGKILPQIDIVAVDQPAAPQAQPPAAQPAA